MMNPSHRRNFLLLNLVGGVLVLGSYVWGSLAVPDTMAALFGGVPVAMQPIYTVNMFLSAAGYFCFAPYIAFRLDAQATDIGGRFGFSLFNFLIAMVLIPSAAWLPLTSRMLSNPSVGLWWIIRADLALVGIGSLGLLLALIALRAPRPPGRIFAIVGLLPFCLQTAVLDGLVWPAFFTMTGP